MMTTMVPTANFWRSRRLWIGVALLLALGLTGLFYTRATTTEKYPLRICLGEDMSVREEILTILHEEAAKCHLALDIKPGTRGEESVQKVIRGEQDIAVIFGGLNIEHPDVRQVACLRGQPLHLFVKPELAPLGLAGLIGKRISVGPANGETQIGVKKVLQHMELNPNTHFIEEHHSFKELSEMSQEELPDAIFASVGLPWPLGRMLVNKFGYRLLEVPFGEVLALRNPAIVDMKIPAHTYGFNPAVPESSIHTVGTYTMVIAHRNVPNKAVYRFLELLCDSEFPRRIGKPPLDTATLQRVREYPHHPGAVEYFNRNESWINQKSVDQFLELRNTLVSAASALLLTWGWFRRRPSQEYTAYLRQITQLEIEAGRALRDAGADLERKVHFLDQLLAIKIEALEQHQAGNLPGDQPLTQFLARVEQARLTITHFGESPRGYSTAPTARMKAG